MLEVDIVAIGKYLIKIRSNISVLFYNIRNYTDKALKKGNEIRFPFFVLYYVFLTITCKLQ